MPDTDNSATLEFYPNLFPLDRNTFYNRDNILRHKSRDDISFESRNKNLKSSVICNSNEGKFFIQKVNFSIVYNREFF